MSLRPAHAYPNPESCHRVFWENLGFKFDHSFLVSQETFIQNCAPDDTLPKLGAFVLIVRTALQLFTWMLVI